MLSQDELNQIRELYEYVTAGITDAERSNKMTAICLCVPALLEHVAEVEKELAELRKYKRRMEWLHQAGPNDAGGCEWGIYRVKWQNGNPAEVWQTNSDFSDLDKEMEAHP